MDRKDYLRMACFGIVLMKTQQNFGSWFMEGIAGWIKEIESQIRLSYQLTANYFADGLKES